MVAITTTSPYAVTSSPTVDGRVCRPLAICGSSPIGIVSVVR
jgi:hypothetical protein